LRWLGGLKKLVAPMAVVWQNKNVHGNVTIELDGEETYLEGGERRCFVDVSSFVLFSRPTHHHNAFPSTLMVPLTTPMHSP